MTHPIKSPYTSRQLTFKTVGLEDIPPIDDLMRGRAHSTDTVIKNPRIDGPMEQRAPQAPRSTAGPGRLSTLRLMQEDGPETFGIRSQAAPEGDIRAWLKLDDDDGSIEVAIVSSTNEEGSHGNQFFRIEQGRQFLGRLADGLTPRPDTSEQLLGELTSTVTPENFVRWFQAGARDIALPADGKYVELESPSDNEDRPRAIWLDNGREPGSEGCMSVLPDNSIELETFTACCSPDAEAPSLQRFRISASSGNLAEVLARDFGVVVQPLNRLVSELAAGSCDLKRFVDWTEVAADRQTIRVVRTFPVQVAAALIPPPNSHVSVGDRVSVTADGRLELWQAIPISAEGPDRGLFTLKGHLIDVVHGDLKTEVAEWLDEPSRPLDELLPMIAAKDLGDLLEWINDSINVSVTEVQPPHWQARPQRIYPMTV